MGRRTTCVCGKVADAHEPARDQDKGTQPKDGSIGVCLYCGQVSIYDSRHPGGQRPLTADETYTMCQQVPDLQQLRHAVLESRTLDEALTAFRATR